MFIKAKEIHRKEIINILNEVSFDLKSQGINQWDYPFEENIINIEEAYIFIENNEIIGVFFLKELKNFYLYKIAIKPRFQGKSYGMKIIEFLKHLSKINNKNFYLDCWAGNEKLKQFYKKCDLKYLGDYPEDDYYVSIFRGDK